MSRQLAFDLPVRTALGRADFFVAAPNALAVDMLDAGRWPEGKLVLTGPEGSGKSHLAAVWAAQTCAPVLDAAALPVPAPLPALVIEDIDRVAGDTAAETLLFHHHNMMRSGGGLLLLTSAAPPGAISFTLPDLASRIAAAQVAILAAPDDPLLTAVMLKQFSDRQMIVPPTLIPWAVSRIERSFAAVSRFVAALDALSLSRQKSVTRALASELLDKSDPGSQ